MNSPETLSAVSSMRLLADCERHLDEAEARWNGVTLREECASLQEMDAAWDALEIARREYETALSANESR